MLSNYVVYDIEVLRNVFTCVLEDEYGSQTVYEISPRKNDLEPFMHKLKELKLNDSYMVGFNNCGYDYPVLHRLINLYQLGETSPRIITKQLFIKSQAIIKSKVMFEHTLWENEHFVKQIDLLKMHHFDNAAKRTSLKKLQFSMRLSNIQEFELDFNKPIKKSKHIDILIEYNCHDVSSTHEFLRRSQTAIDFRTTLNTVDKSYYNMNDTKIGENYFIERLKNDVGEHVMYQRVSGRRVKRITERSVIPLDEIIFDNIYFDSPEMTALLNRIKKLNMFVIKGKFYWNEHLDYPQKKVELEQWAKDLRKRKKSMVKVDYDAEKQNLDAQLKKYADHHINLELDGVVFELGKGGLHATVRKEIVHSDKEFVIYDLDVTSYYPSIGIAYWLFPEHLTDAFCPIYANLKLDRLQFTKSEYPVQNLILKLALNGTYGKTNSKYSVFCDPKYTVTTTVNGQLMLMMLWDKLRRIPDCQIIQANTDGITIRCRREHRQLVGKVCRWWQKHTRMELEQATYSRMWVRDGNNYIAEYTNGKLKAKGDYNYHSLYYDSGLSGDGVEWYKDHSMLVVRKAVEAYLVNGIPVDEFIKSHQDLYDFFLVTNVNRSSRLMWGDGTTNKSPKTLTGDNQELQRNTRYLVTKTGGYLTKILPPLKGKVNERCSSITAGYLTTPMNKVVNDDVYAHKIDYDFYIAEANKLIKVFK